MIKDKNQQLHVAALSQSCIFIVFHMWDLQMKLLTLCKSKVHKQGSVSAGKAAQLSLRDY